MPNVTVPAAAPGLPEDTAAASRRGFLRSGAMAALAGAVAAPVAVGAAETPAISPELERLIEAHRQADKRFDDVLAVLSRAEDRCFAAMQDAGLDHRTSYSAEIRAAAGVERAEHDESEACAAESAALDSLCSAPFRSLADVRRWALYLVEFEGSITDEQYDRALRALAGLPAEEEA